MAMGNERKVSDMKRILCILMALLALAWGFAALAEGVSWEFDTYNYELEGYSGTVSELVIPAKIEGCTVDIIGLNVLQSAQGVTAITLPETVRQIENGAISFCEDLTSLTLNEGLVVVGDNVVICNDMLAEVRIPASVCYIGERSFYNCMNLEKVVFEGECPVILADAFTSLAEDVVFVIPDDRMDEYAQAFARLDLYPDLQASGSVAKQVDYSCSPEQFVFDPDNGMIVSYEGYDVRVDVPADIDGVPVRGIAAQAFADKPYLCYVTLPEGVEVIGEAAFENCGRLVHVDFPSTLREIGSRAFARCSAIRKLNLPEGLEVIGSEAFDDAIRISGALHLPQGLREIGDRAFAHCNWLEEIYIPSSVDAIGENAFEDCGFNYAVFEGSTLPQMPDNVFTDCYYLADIDLHTKATRQEMLELQAVVDALGLSCRVWRMQNPDVEYIEDGLDVYAGDTMTGYTGSQTHIRPWDTFDDIDITALGDGAFKGNTVIEYFAVPYNDAFTTIGAEAFADSCVRVVDLFDSVTTVGEGAFRNCIYLEELVLPESVTSVGSGALAGCTGLKKLTVLCDPAVLPDDLLAGCAPELEICVAETATDEQLKTLSRVAGRAWNNPVTRPGEPLPCVEPMPYAALPGEDFWYDAEFSRLDNYMGYERNLILPREIDGVALAMLGGSVMNRASCGDNYEMELPVVSVVIPETYTEIVPYAFANCETLETVICYAPIELLPEGAFSNCTALREVIFVNSVRAVEAYAFENCPNLETVYVGPYVETVSEDAFAGEALNPITDPAMMPDVDALLASVKRDPAPTPAPTATPAPAVPVGPEGEAFLGMWNGTQMELGGDVMDLAVLDMAFSLYLTADGRMLISDEEIGDVSLAPDDAWINWYLEDGAAFCAEGSMLILEDGSLRLEQDGMAILFTREGAEIVPGAPATTPATAAEPIRSEVPAADAGSLMETKYVCVSADVEGVTIQASMLGAEYALVFHEDGTSDFTVAGVTVPGHPVGGA